MDKDTNFVVYGFLRQDYSSFYYIGKGRPYRPYQSRKRTIPHPGCNSRVVILYENISEELALENERKLISLIGRIGIDPDGTLRNISSGGCGVSQKHSKELKMKLKLYENKKLLMMRRNWFHPVIGEVFNLTPKELKNKYPEQNLNQWEINKVFKGKKHFHKGWRLLENQVLQNDFSPAQIRDWYHPVYGELYKKTYRDLVRVDASLKIESLRLAGSGKILSYKGWRLLGNKDKKVYRGRKHDWYHPTHGDIKGKSCRELSEIYNLKEKYLIKVAGGFSNSYIGWLLLSNKHYKPKTINTKKYRSWKHKEFGCISGVTAGELVQMFPDQNLSADCLRGLRENPGKRSHKGWTMLE
jgi:hypothetical protein